MSDATITKMSIMIIIKAGLFCRMERYVLVSCAITHRSCSLKNTSEPSYNLQTFDDIILTPCSVSSHHKNIDMQTLHIVGVSSSNNKNMRLDDLTDAQLHRKLVEHGCSAYPVTPTTRKVLIQKLRRLLGSTRIESFDDSLARDPNPKVSPLIKPNPNAPSPSNSNLKSSLASTSNLKNILSTGNSTCRNFSTCVPNLDNNLQLLFFDIETSGLETNCDILQISVRFGSSTFNRYINPTQPISWKASQVNHLYNRDGLLYRDTELLESRPLCNVLQELLLYLQTFEQKCILVAHNCPFDSRRLVNAIKRYSMTDSFSRVVDGFTDTLAMFRKKYPERRGQRGALKLTTLVNESLDVSTDAAHDAHYDTLLLEKLSLLHFSPEQLINARISFEQALDK